MNWTANLGNGLSYDAAVAGFVNSAEFQLRYGALSDSDFVTLLYVSMLDDERLTAAVGYAWTIQFFTISVGIGFAIAATAMVSRSLGARERGQGQSPYCRTTFSQPSPFWIIITVALGKFPCIFLTLASTAVVLVARMTRSADLSASRRRWR